MRKREAEARVAKGAALLDEKRPGWAERMNTGTLDLSSVAHCIIGQECGHYAHITTVVSFDRAFACGFDIDDEDRSDEETKETAFRLLQDAWIAAIADRLVSAPAERVADGRLQESQP